MKMIGKMNMDIKILTAFPLLVLFGATAPWATAQDRPTKVNDKLIDKPSISTTSVDESRSGSKMNEQQQKLLKKAEVALQQRRYAEAIRLLNGIVNNKESAYHRAALERLGIAREKNGQKAHAKTIYQNYLQEFPDDEAASRIRQRLAELISTQIEVKKPIIKARSSFVRTKKKQQLFGSFNQILTFSRNDLATRSQQIEQSQVISTLDLNARYRGPTEKYRISIRSDHNYNLLDRENEGADIRSMLLEYKNNKNYQLSVGRQRSSQGGVLGRFDGVAGEFEITPTWGFNATGGFPVGFDTLDRIQKNKQFSGMSLDYHKDSFSIRPYSLLQRVDGMVDRMAVGEEIDLFNQNGFVRQVLDYDLHFGKWNMLSVQGNYKFNNIVTTNAMFDMRRSPLLETENALISEFRADTIWELQELLTEAEITQQANDRTGRSIYITTGVNFDFNSDFYMRIDLSRSQQDFKFSYEQDGEEVVETTRDIQHEISQQIGYSNLVPGLQDMAATDLRYSKAENYTLYQGGLRYRLRFYKSLLIDHRLQLKYRTSSRGESVWITRPMLKLNYQWQKTIWNQFEVGYEWWNYGSSNQVDYQRAFFNLVYRYVF